MKDCSACTSSARCGRCRTAIFSLRKARGVCSGAATPTQQRSKRQRRQPPPTPARSPAADDRLDFPRDRSGYQQYLALLEAQGGGVSRAGTHWLFEPESPNLLLERVVPKDNYETPAWLWRRYCAREHLTVDANATALNAVAPTYLQQATTRYLIYRSLMGQK